MSKIISLWDFNPVLPRFGWVTTHAHGCFDVLHLGHIKHLQAAQKLSGGLIVTVTPDHFVNKPGRPVFSAEQRAECLAALECVDFVAINHWPDAVQAIRLLRPRIYVKGSEYRDNMTDLLRQEKDAVESVGGRLEFVGEDICHTTDLLRCMEVCK